MNPHHNSSTCVLASPVATAAVSVAFLALGVLVLWAGIRVGESRIWSSHIGWFFLTFLHGVTLGVLLSAAVALLYWLNSLHPFGFWLPAGVLALVYFAITLYTWIQAYNAVLAF